MPYTINKNIDGSKVETKYFGIVTDNDLLQSANDRLKPPEDELKKIRILLSDFTNVESFKISTNAIKQNAELAKYASKINVKIILVAVMPTDLEYGMGRMWQAYADNDETKWKTKIVRTLDEAYEWIESNVTSNK